MDTRTKPLTPGRMRCLQGLAYGALHMNDVAKESFVAMIVPGKTSFRQLTNAEADKVIDAMKLKAGQPPTRPNASERRKAHASDVAMLVTPAQRDLVTALRTQLLERGFASPYVNGIAERACGRPDPRTSDEAEKAIEAFKAKLARGVAPPEPA